MITHSDPDNGGCCRWVLSLQHIRRIIYMGRARWHCVVVWYKTVLPISFRVTSFNHEEYGTRITWTVNVAKQNKSQQKYIHISWHSLPMIIRSRIIPRSFCQGMTQIVAFSEWHYCILFHTFSNTFMITSASFSRWCHFRKKAGDEFDDSVNTK